MPFVQGDAGRRRGGPLVAAAVLASAVHLALWLLVQSRDSGPPERRAVSGAESLTLVPARRAAPPMQAPIAPPVAVAQKLAQQQTPAAPVEPPTARPPNDKTPERELAYFPADAVDTRARPIVDWVLRPEVLPPDRLYSVIFTVWVAADGRIDHWQVQRQSPPGAWAGELLADLKGTPMSPARLAGRAVASETTIELALDNRLR